MRSLSADRTFRLERHIRGENRKEEVVFCEGKRLSLSWRRLYTLRLWSLPLLDPFGLPGYSIYGIPTVAGSSLK